MDEKQLPEADPVKIAQYLRKRAAGHAPGYDIAIYARPYMWLALADALDPPETTETGTPITGALEDRK